MFGEEEDVSLLYQSTKPIRVEARRLLVVLDNSFLHSHSSPPPNNEFYLVFERKAKNKLEAVEKLFSMSDSYSKCRFTNLHGLLLLVCQGN